MYCLSLVNFYLYIEYLSRFSYYCTVTAVIFFICLLYIYHLIWRYMYQTYS